MNNREKIEEIIKKKEKNELEKEVKRKLRAMINDGSFFTAMIYWKTQAMFVGFLLGIMVTLAVCLVVFY